MPTYLSTDPNAGKREEPQYLSTDPDEGEPIQDAPQAAPAAPGRPGWSGQNYVDAAKGLVGGLAKSAYNTVAGATQVLAPVAAAVGLEKQFPPLRSAPIEPGEEVANKVGQVAQFFVPGMNAAKGAGLLRATAQAGATAAGLTAAQQGEVGPTAAVSGALGAAGPLVAAGARKIAPILAEGAQRQMARVLGPTTKENKAITEKVAPVMLEKGLKAITRQSLMNKATSKLAKTGFDLEKALEKIPQGERVNTGPILKHLDDAKQAFIVDGVVLDAEAVARFEGLQKTIAEYGPDVSFRSLRRVRQVYDDVVAQARGFHGKTLAEGSAVEAKRELANSIRAELAKTAPDVAKINKEYSFWANVEKVMGDTLERTQSQAKPLGEQLLRAAGAAGGMASSGVPGAVTGAVAMDSLTKAMRSTAWNTWSAGRKWKLAESIAAGRFNEAARLLSSSAAAIPAAVSSRE